MIRLTIIFVVLAVAMSALAQPRLPPNLPLEQGPVLPGRLPQVDLSGLLPKHWDFEDGTLQGFVSEDIAGSTAGAFRNQPTFGDNVSTRRALDVASAQLPADPCAGLVLDALTTCQYAEGNVFEYLTRLRHDLQQLRTDLDVIGGSYWNTPFPIGKQGLFWIGSAESRPKTSAAAWGTMSGDRVTGRLVSPQVTLDYRYFSFLVGGGCSTNVGVYLQSEQPVLHLPTPTVPGAPGVPNLPAPTVTNRWVTVKDSHGKPVEARGACMENMVRYTFDISNLKGTKARILIEDRGTAAFEHINVDDIWLTGTAPPASARDRDPVWGVADLHAHLMNEKGYIAYNASGTTPDARLLWGSALGPIENLRGCNDTHTTNDWNYSSFQDEAWGTTYTLCRDMCINMLDGAGLPDLPGDQIDQSPWLGGFHDTNGGFPSFTAWPMWWSSAHQQMHWTWVKRAYQGGVRMMVAAVGNSEVLSYALSKERANPFESDQDALALQIPAIKEFARQNRSWAEVAYTPRDARRIINSGKLAIVIGVELDHVIDSCSADITSTRHHTASENSEPNIWVAGHHFDAGLGSVIAGLLNLAGHTRVVNYTGHPATCTATQLEARLDALYRAGVRQILPVHFSDNLLGGYAINDGKFFASAIFGNAGAHPPELMSQANLEASFGTAARPFTPVAHEAYYGENRDRRAQWERARPIQLKLTELYLPMWVELLASAVLDGTFLPPGIGRSIEEFFSGRCISDTGWRIFAAIFTAGASEAACGISTLTDEAFNAARSTMPYEGATDSALTLPLDAPHAWADLSFHVNARALTRDGEVFIRQMMRRGMMIDMQHSSEMTKRGILGVTGSYPVMVSHGGVQTGASRANENVLSTSQLATVYAPPNGLASGIVGIGAQSSRGFVDQVRAVATGGETAGFARSKELMTRSVALGTDLNGMDWHAPPRFGKFADYPGIGLYPGDPARERSERQRFGLGGGIGPMVAYAPYPAGTNPWATTQPTCNSSPCTGWSSRAVGTPLNALQISNGGVVTRTFDINFDGLAHYGLLPDFFQELGVLGASSEEMGAVFRSAEGTIKMWEEGCWQAYGMSSHPASLAIGCGPAELYR